MSKPIATKASSRPKARVTIEDVARHAGVSSMTVSRVVNRSPQVRPDTRRRVEAAIAELHYVPNRVAQNLIRRRTGAIGLVVPDMANPFFTSIIHGAEDVAWRAGYHVILANTQADLKRERGHLTDLLSFQAEGVLIAPVSDKSRPHLRLLAGNGIPYVLVDRSLKDDRSDVVQGDSVGGARRLVEHLIGLGHRRIALVTEKLEVSTSRDRLKGYRDGLVGAGVGFRPELVIMGSTASDPRCGSEGVSALLALPDPPTAVVAVNNIVAVGVIEAARERGLEIPDDLAVVCFDDIELLSRLYPFLTVMAQPAEALGTQAMQLLLDRIAGRAKAGRRTVVLPAQLVVRRSCGGACGDASGGSPFARYDEHDQGRLPAHP